MPCSHGDKWGKLENGMTESFRIAALLASGFASMAAPHGYAQTVMRGAEQTPAVFSAHLPSLRGAMAQTEGIGAEHRVRELKLIPLVDAPGQASDPVVQSRAGTSAGITPGLGFDGIGVGLGSYSPQYAPPDTTGAVGATQNANRGRSGESSGSNRRSSDCLGKWRRKARRVAPRAL